MHYIPQLDSVNEVLEEQFFFGQNVCGQYSRGCPFYISVKLRFTPPLYADTSLIRTHFLVPTGV